MPVSKTSDYRASQIADSEALIPMAFSKQLAQSASFDRFFATSHGIRLMPASAPVTLFSVDSIAADTQQADYQGAERTAAIHAGGQSPANNNQHSNHDRSLDLAIPGSSRFASLLRHDPEETQPSYQLAIELPIEPVPSFAKDYRVDMLSSLDWTLKTSPPSGRISGWKESNLIYTVYHHRLPLA